jgi:hypothetical protein
MSITLTTLPACTAEAERKLSKVGNTLAALRSTKSEERFHALEMLQAHRDLLPSTDAIIDKYILSGADGRSRMDFNIS